MRLLILGIDALDPYFIEEFLPHLPTFQWLREAARWHVVQCDAEVPNSPAGWNTIYSGLPAEKHGFLDWDYISSIGGTWKGTADKLPRRFWDELNKAGLSVGLMCAPLVWPAPQLDGWAVAGFPTPYQFPEQASDYPSCDGLYSGENIKALEPIGHVVDTIQYKSNVDRSKWLNGPRIENIESLPMLRLEYALRAFRLLPVDVGFVFFGYLDRLAHTLNTLCWLDGRITPDEARDKMFWAYKKVDRCIALAISAIEAIMVIVVGDHGHNFSTTVPALGEDDKVIEGEPRFMSHTWETALFALGFGSSGKGDGLELAEVYGKIMSCADEEVIQGKLRQLGYID